MMNNKGTTSSELDQILRLRREASDEPPPPPPPPLPRSAASSGKSFSRKSSPQQFSPTFNDSFITQPLGTLHFDNDTADSSLNDDWSWDPPNNSPLLNEKHPAFATDFGGDTVDFTDVTQPSSANEETYEEELVFDDDEECDDDKAFKDKPAQNLCEAEISLQSFPILSHPHPIQALSHPFNGHVILCRSRPRHRSGKLTSEEWFLDEIDPTCNRASIVASIPILSSQFMQCFSSPDHPPNILADAEWTNKRPIGLKQVVHMTVGVESRNSSTQVFVAAILDLAVVGHSIVKMKKEDVSHSSSTSAANTKSTHNTLAHAIQDVVRVIAVWHLACTQGSTMVLRQVLPPPKGNFLYDPHTLALADGLLFLGGSMKGYPHIFTFTLDARDSWSCTPVILPIPLLPLPASEGKVEQDEQASDKSKSISTRVVALACTLHRIRKYKYLAVALDNGDMGVMTYHPPHFKKSIMDEALNDSSKNADSAKSFVQLLVTLQGVTNLYRPETPHLMERNGNHQDPPVQSEYAKTFCTQLAWIFPGPSCNNLPLLAASYPNGVFIYLVSLKFAVECNIVIESSNPVPVIKSTKENAISASTFRKKTPATLDSASNASSMEIFTSSTTSKSLVLYPICMSRIFVNKDMDDKAAFSCYMAWFDIGSRFPPCLGILSVDHNNDTHLILTSLSVDHDSKPNRMVKLCSLSLGATEQNNAGLLFSTSLGSILQVSRNSITAFTPVLLKLGQEKPSPPLSSSGPDPLFSHYTQPVSSPALGIDSKGYVIQETRDDFVLHIFSSIQCEKHEDFPHVRLHMKHLLCMTTVGDRNSAWIDNTKSLSIHKPFNTREPSGGAHCRVIKDLSCHKLHCHLRPERISIFRQWAAVLFSRAISESDVSKKTMISLLPEFVAIFNITETSSGSISDEFELIKGRDISFCSSDINSTALIIDQTGHYIYQMIYEENRWTRLRSFPALSQTHFSMNRIHILNSGKIICSGQDESGHINLFSVGSCNLSDNRSSFNFFRVKKLHDVISLNAQEEIVQFLEVNETNALGDGHIIFTASTLFQILTIRVVHRKMMQLLSKIRKQSFGSLAPIGNLCVAYFSPATTSHHMRLEYTSSLKGLGSRGIIATIPTSTFCHRSISLLALRPDRFLYLDAHACSGLSEEGENNRVPIALTRPICPLEPLISNYLAQAPETTRESFSKLQDIVERFCNRNNDENKMVEPFASGITCTILSMLSRYGFSGVVQHLLHTGVKGLESSGSSRGRVQSPIPAWTKIQEKNSPITIGDFDLSEHYMKGAQETPMTLPLTSDPASTIARLLANSALRNKQIHHALGFLDFAGDYSADETILLLTLSLDVARENSVSENCETFSELALTHSLASLLQYLRSLKDDKKERSKLTLTSIIRNFSLSYQKGLNTLLRSRNDLSSLLLEAIIQASTQDKDIDAREEPITNMADGKSVWHTGPFDDKERLLQLSHLEHWLGCRLIPVLGKEGVDAIAGTGDKLLASLVLADMNSADLQSDDNSSRDASRGGWVDGVGEGRSDEDNLTLYLRFSEGVDENRHWTTNGFQDLSHYSNSVLVFGPNNLSLENTSSSVDGGEDGKVKMLYDLVFDGIYDEKVKSFLCVEVRRGSSLDLGCWHNSNYHESRQRGSLEFWYFVPEGLVYDEIILARRSLCLPGSVLSLEDEPIESHLLWELVLHSNGSIKFRTQSGSLTSLATVGNKSRTNKDDSSEVSESESDASCGFYQGWNHICVTFNSRNKPHSVSQVSLIIKGLLVASSPLTFDCPGLDLHRNENSKNIDETLDRTFLLFGLGARSGFRMTELRYWACERSVDDTRMMMYEYLSAAETRRKLHVKIRNKNVRPKPLLAVNSSIVPPRNFRVFEDANIFNSATAAQQSDIVWTESIDYKSTLKEDASISNKFECAGESNKEAGLVHDSRGNLNPIRWSIQVSYSYELSKYMKTSIASAIVRGPNATNHFGGNTGGFPLESPREMARNITICGTEKTVIFRCDHAPTATTYPVGAAGAILWKNPDENGSEYLACYQAKDKRIIVFDLRSNTVIVELQMSLKLIFWRYLPPESHGKNVTIMLVTSSGGFHFLPLDESPRPRQAFGKDICCLQGKKVIAYEEGGANGKDGRDMRSTLALLLLSTQKSSFVEVQCLLLFESSPQASLCISTEVLGAALFLPTHFADANDPTLPLVIIVSTSESSDFEFRVEILSLAKRSDGSLAQGASLSQILVPKILQEDETIEEPSLTIGLCPTFLCLCCNDHVAVVDRAKGHLFVFTYSDRDHELSFIGRHCFHAFVVDATIRCGQNSLEVEIILLLCGSDSSKHGLISSCFVLKAHE